ncbi:RHS repeat-associated core domain-containing protein [Pseudomonas sp. KCJK9044]|uniref:RHS repeat-associated core domain-containing protein n=1 Tax=Pseudomonas sp. KCJK9044 TaxID=3344562 RepID=UPI003905BF02
MKNRLENGVGENWLIVQRLPKAGRFISKDPISYRGGINLFAYTANPVLWVDPLGLAKK